MRISDWSSDVCSSDLLISVMDHTPGQRQFVKPEKYRQYYQGKYGLTDEAMDTFMAGQIAAAEANGAANRRAIVDLCRAKGLPLASHDDATAEHVAEAAADRKSTRLNSSH